MVFLCNLHLCECTKAPESCRVRLPSVITQQFPYGSRKVTGNIRISGPPGVNKGLSFRKGKWNWEDNWSVYEAGRGLLCFKESGIKEVTHTEVKYVKFGYNFI